MTLMKTLNAAFLMQTVGTIVSETITKLCQALTDKVKTITIWLYCWWYGYYYYTLTYSRKDMEYRVTNTRDTIDAIIYCVGKQTMISSGTVCATGNDEGPPVIKPIEWVTHRDSLYKFMCIKEDYNETYTLCTYSKYNNIEFGKFCSMCNEEYTNETRLTDFKNTMFYYSDHDFIKCKSSTALDPKSYIMPQRAQIDKHVALLKGGKLSKLNILAYGPPGSGKTTVGRYIINAYPEYCPFIVSLSDIESRDELYRLLYSDIVHTDSRNYTIPIANRIYILEDIDCAGKSVKKRKYDAIDVEDEMLPKKDDANSKGLSMSDILNALDGVNDMRGCIMLFTTNHVEKLDPAMVRHGRMNLILKIDKLSADYVQQIIKHNCNIDIDASSIDMKYTLAELYAAVLSFESGDFVKYIDSVMAK